MASTTIHPDGVICPLCGWSGPEFGPMGRLARPNAVCPHCKSLERHRALFLYLRDETEVFSKPTRLLHFAPEAAIWPVFEQLENIEYITTDLEMPGVTLRMDIRDLLFRDDVFDCVICSHVLEHVDDDRAAMREIARVLRPHGVAIIMVPILDTPDGRTVEDRAIVTAEQRERVYGQSDHVRKYGLDFPERAREAGFDVDVVRIADSVGHETTARYGLDSGEQIFVCTPHGSTNGRPPSRTAPATKPDQPPLDFIREIAPNDPMMNAERPDHYFAVGNGALRIVQNALEAVEASPPGTILDLPSGYGRVLRMLTAAFPGAAITACDANPEMVEFCGRVFGVETVVADRDPAALALPRAYDFIWCGSLVTHLPEPRIRSLLERFARHLTPAGLLVFTTHGDMIEDLLSAGRMSPPIAATAPATLSARYAADGFAFEPYENSADGTYGLALTSKEWVAGAVGQTPGLALVSHTEAEWDGKQDVAVCRPSQPTDIR